MTGVADTNVAALIDWNGKKYYNSLYWNRDLEN
jgi:hypothetical protein